MLLKEDWPDIINPVMFKYFNNEYREVEKMNPFFYNFQTSEIFQEVLSSAGEFPDLISFNGTIDYTDMFEGYDKTFRHEEYARGMQIRSTLMSDAKGAGHGFVFTEKPQAMARATSRTREKQGVTPLNDAFVSEPTDGDGVELCGDDHPNPDPDNTGTQTNEGTGTFGATEVEATRIAISQFEDDQGDFIGAEMNTLVVPEALFSQAWEIVNSTGKTDTANNNKNFHYGRYNLSRNRRLSDSSNWFGIDSKMMKNMFFWFNREPVTYFKDKSSDTLSAKYISYYRMSRSWRNWRFIYGNLVS